VPGDSNLTRYQSQVQYSRTPLFRTLVIRIGWALTSKFFENSTKLTYLEVTGYRIRHSTVLWLLELQNRRGRKIQTQVQTVNSNSRTSNYQCGLFSKKNSIILIFCIAGEFAIPINPDKWSYTVLTVTISVGNDRHGQDRGYVSHLK